MAGHPPPDHRHDHPRRPDLGAARARRRLPPRAVRPRQHLPQRLDPRHVAASRSTPRSTRSSSSAGSSEFIDTPVKVYSSGMYVRLGFSIAVNLDPEILIIDEIIAVGDEEFQRRCFDHLYELRKRGVTIVFVSHSLPLVQTLCDRVAWLDHGQAARRGTGAARSSTSTWRRSTRPSRSGSRPRAHGRARRTTSRVGAAPARPTVTGVAVRRLRRRGPTVVTSGERS